MTPTSVTSHGNLKADKLFSVSHITAVVTGGGTGIGLMIARALAENGATVYITGRREEALQTVVDEYSPSESGKLIAMPGDVSDKSDIQRLASEISQKSPKGIHLLVNNAGIARDDKTSYSSNGEPDFKSAESISKHLLESDPQSWTDTFNTNITGQFFTTAAFLPLLAKGQDVTPGYTSSVVNITSISGVMKGSSSGQFAYATSKAGFIHLTRMMATTFSEAKIRVNSIAPGLFPSEMTAGEADDKQQNVIDKKLSNPAGRAGTAEDMAACILYLAGPGGVFLNGQVIYPDGGNILVQPAAT